MAHASGSSDQISPIFAASRILCFPPPRVLWASLPPSHGPLLLSWRGRGAHVPLGKEEGAPCPGLCSIISFEPVQSQP